MSVCPWQKKQVEDTLMKKQHSKEMELERLKREEKRERQSRAEAAFNTWKHHKDSEWETERQLMNIDHRSMTPPTRGMAVYREL